MTEKINKLQELFNEYKAGFPENRFVKGDGDVSARIMLIGEAPGKEEVAQGKPFVGKAGKNLEEFLSFIGLKREKIYITNVIKYKLSKFKVSEETGKILSESNRPARPEEIRAGIPFLLREIEIVAPEYIVTLGNVPLKAVLNDLSGSITIGEYHGKSRMIYIGENTYKLYPLYHPASIIYNRALKEVYNRDVLRLGEMIGKM